MSSGSPKSPLVVAPPIDFSKRGEAPILFGTSGWRGALGEEVTFPRLRVLVRAIAEWLFERDHGSQVLVGWDTRFASRAMAEMSASILSEAGFVPLLSTTSLPTPAITHALAHGDFAAAIVLTASHNPALDHGLKLFGRSGATIPDVEARRIEAIARTRLHDEGVAPRPSVPFQADFLTDYRRSLLAHLDSEAISRSGLVVVYDALYGTGGGILDEVLEVAGATVHRLHCDRDPTFGGSAPDPVPDRLGDLERQTARIGGRVLGLATDGDGDRFGAVDGTGRVLSETQVVALLVDHLASNGKIDRGVAITEGTGSLVEKVAKAHGLAVERHPVGFKHLSAAIDAGRCDVAGEESGGFAFAPMGPDKDGLLAGCLLANLVATTEVGLEGHLHRLESQFGISACGRSALPLTPARDAALERLRAAPPRRVAGVEISEECVDRSWGMRLGFPDDGFLILRRSGTEPLLRIYAEAKSPAELAERLGAGQRLLDEVSGPG